MSGQSVEREAEGLFRRARRSERLWPIGLLVALLYLASSCWSFTRAFGETGAVATVRALPSAWVLLGLVAIVVAGHALSRAAERAGASPFFWTRQARRLLIALAVVLPVLMFAVEPALAIMAVDAGRVDGGTLGGWLLTVRITPSG